MLPRLYLSFKLYGPRPLAHFDAYRLLPGWFFVEWWHFTLELDMNPQ